MSRPSATENTARLAELVAAQALPASALAHARDRVIDTIGVASCGARLPVVHRIRAALTGTGANDPGTIWGTTATSTPSTAALVNAAATHSEDFDDTHAGAVVHGSACIVPAAWAAAEAEDVDAATLLAAVVVGWEVTTRIGLAAGGTMHARGWHTSSVAGAFGAAAAAGTVWGLDGRQLVHALGLAGSAAGGINAYLQNGSDGKLMNIGWAAANGMQAAELAKAGVTGPPSVLEGRFGLFEATTDERPDVGRWYEDIGERWQIEDVSTKPYPVCHFAHSPIEAALDLRRRGIRAAEIHRITAYVPPLAVEVLCVPWEAKLDPPTAYAVRFSLPRLLAMALIDGEIGPESLDTGCLERDDVRALATRIEVVTWTNSPYPVTFPGRVAVRLRDGSSHRAEVLVNPGHPRAPLNSLDDKFRGCLRMAAGTNGDDAGSVLKALRTMDESTAVRAMSRLLREWAQSCESDA